MNNDANKREIAQVANPIGQKTCGIDHDNPVELITIGAIAMMYDRL